MDSSFRPWGMEHKTFLLLMHLSQLTSFVAPGLGLILPVVMWVTNKEHSAEIDEHGKVIVNWIISLLIYSAICFVLTFVFIGVIGFIILGAMNLIFVILGAIKANDGVLWPYPLSIKILTTR